MSQILWANNASTTIAGTVSNVAVTVNLTPGAGALFPAPGVGQYFVATFVDAATGLLNEIVHVTNVTGDVATIVRAQEGTTALAWAAGDSFSNLVTAGTLAAFGQIALQRTFLAVDTTFYVATTGSDSTGTGAVGFPWATVQHAFDVLQESYDLAGFNATISVADGTYTGGLAASGALVGQSGSASLIISGNTGTPANVFFNCTGTAFAIDSGAGITLQGMKIASSAGYGVRCDGMGNINMGAGIQLSTCSLGHAYANAGGQIDFGQNYAIIGSAPSHHIARYTGVIGFASTKTITLVGTPAFSTAFADADRLGVIGYAGAVFAGTGATGSRYSVTGNAVVDTNGGGGTYLPGDAGGTTGTGGQYI